MASSEPDTKGSKRIKGNALAFKLGEDDTNYWMDLTSCELENEEKDSDTVTFYDAAHSGEERRWFFTVEAVQSTDENSFWRWCWDHTDEEVAFTYAPHGNDEASKDKPHFSGHCKLKERPSIGGDAGEDEEYTFESELELTSGPHLDDGSGSGDES